MASCLILHPLHAGPGQPFSWKSDRLGTPSSPGDSMICGTNASASRPVIKPVLVKEALLKAYRPHPVCRSPFVAQWSLQLHQESPQVVHTNIAPPLGVIARPHQLQRTRFWPQSCWLC